jgi:two-component system OmpR family response regulator
MDLGGNLSILDPSSIFQLLNMSAMTGELKLVTVDSVASFYFKEGELVYATTDKKKKKLGRFLIEKGRITEEQLYEALKEFWLHQGNKRIGNILIEKGFLERDLLVDAIQEQIKDVVYSVLSWNEGQFIFFRSVEPRDEDILLDVKMDHLILEGLKRLDESKEP